jgi:dihydroorotase-like cyclic amidohydrolase
LSTKEGLELIRRAKAEGMLITAETCPHYLMFNSKYFEEMGPYARCIPPLRSEEDRLSMWQGLMDGTIDFISSDHSPKTKAQKDLGWENIWLAPNGSPGVETMLPIMLDQVNGGIIQLQKIAYAMATRPAQVFDIYPRKGVIMLGSDADLAVVDMKKEGSEDGTVIGKKGFGKFQKRIKRKQPTRN